MYIKLAGSSDDFRVMVFELHITLHYEDSINVSTVFSKWSFLLIRCLCVVSDVSDSFRSDVYVKPTVISAKLYAAIPGHDHCEPVLKGRTFSVLLYVDIKFFNFRYDTIQ